MFMWNIYLTRDLNLFAQCLYGIYCFSLVSSFTFSEQPIFREFTTKNLTQQLKHAVDKILKLNFTSEYNLFQWTTVTGFKEIVNDTRKVWLIFSGSIDRINLSPVNPFTKKAAGVIACWLTLDVEHIFWLHLDGCFPMEIKNISNQENEHNTKYHEGTTLLGMSLGSLELEKPVSGAVIVYCDPLWHTGRRKYVSPSLRDVKYQEQPGGRCHIRLRHNGKWSRQIKSNQSEDIIQFCTNSGYSQPCGGGFSFDLQRSSSTDQTAHSYKSYSDHHDSQLPNIQLLTSLFLANPGEVQIVDDILMNFKKTSHKQKTEFTVRRILGDHVQFSQQVKWTPFSKSVKHHFDLGDNESISDGNAWMHENLAIVSSLGSICEPNITAFKPKATESKEWLVYSIVNENKMNSDTSIDFTGFGFSIETVNILKRSKDNGVPRTNYGILIGAPFDSSIKDNNPNRGRVYIVCPEKRMISKTGLFSIKGTRKNELFGYSIARLGDIDGDGIDDVAISAPAIQSINTKVLNGNLNISLYNGRVYIYRITSQCTLESQPLQILESPKPEIGDGFGIGLSRGFDADGDGWPEFAVASLKMNTLPYLFTMPKLLKAQCQINIPPLYSMLHFKKDITIPFHINVRLYDLHLRQYINIPEGLTLTGIRDHEVITDVLWNYYLHSNSTTTTLSSDLFKKQSIELSVFNLFTVQFNKLTPRFRLQDKKINDIHLDSSQSSMSIKFHLITMYGLEEMNLDSIPLKISYRSSLNLTECNFAQNFNKCYKQNQPLVDWSECSQSIRLAQPVCIPANECSSDFSFMNVSWNSLHSPIMTQNSENILIKVNNSLIKSIEYGHPYEQQQLIQLKLVNLGPTKSTGLRILARFYNWHFINDEKSTLNNGIQGKITRVNIKKLPKNTTDSLDLINLTDTKIWSINIDENGLLALISLSPYLWIYPNEIIQIDIHVFIQSLLPLTTTRSTSYLLNDDTVFFKYFNQNYEYPPKFEIQVISVTQDDHKENNIVSIPYKIVYKPVVNIFAGIQPSTIIDKRLKPYSIDRNTLSRKIFSYDIGPRIEHTFLIENRGWITLTNLSLILQLPYEIFDGYRLLYLSDQIREASHTNQTTVLKNILPSIIGSDGRQYGNCEIPKEFINPLELTLMDFKFIDDITRKSTYNSLVRIAKRFKRGIEELSESSLASLNKHKPIRDSEIGLTYNTLQRDYENRIILNCPHFRQSVNSTKDIRTIENKYLIKCINIQCQIKHFERGDTVRLKWIGWLWAETFFKLHKSDIQFVSRLHIDHWGDLPLIIKSYHDIQENLFRNKSHTMNEKFIDIKYPSNNYFELKQSIIFHSVQLKVTHKVPLWPIIAGIIVGLSILMILSALLYCGGFFTRRRKYSAIKAKKCLFSLENKHLDEKSHNNSNINSLFNWTTSQNSLIKTVENCSLLQSSDSQLPTSIKKHQFDFDYSEKTSPSNLNENLIVEQHSTDKNDEHVPNNKYQQSLLKILVKPNENDDCISPLLKPSNLSLYEQHKSQQLEVIEEDKESSTTIVDNN